MGRLENLRVVDPVLTELARGYKFNELVSETLAPMVIVSKETGKIPQFGKEAFKLYSTERAIRARSNRINPEGRTEIDLVTTEHDLEYPIDYREKAEDAMDREMLRRWANRIVEQGIMIKREKMFADLAQDEANYPSGNKVTLTGTDKWSDLDDSDPVGDVEEAKDAIRQKIGAIPRSGVIGYATYKLLKTHPKLLELVKYTEDGAHRLITLDILRVIFDLPGLVLGMSQFATDAGVFTDIWSDNFIVAYVPEQGNDEERSEFEPSFAYTFRREGNPTVDTYTENGGKLELIRNTDNFAVKIVGADAGYLIKDTN